MWGLCGCFVETVSLWGLWCYVLELLGLEVAFADALLQGCYA